MVTKNEKGVGERGGGESKKDRTGAKEQGREAYDQRLTGLRQVEEKKTSHSSIQTYGMFAS